METVVINHKEYVVTKRIARWECMPLSRENMRKNKQAAYVTVRRPKGTHERIAIEFENGTYSFIN